MKEFFSTFPYAAWSMVSVLVAAVFIATFWEQVKWWWHNTYYSLPLIGGIARLSKDSNRDAANANWFKAEKTLCRDYKKFVRIQDEHDFKESITYLTKAGDNGRKPTPGWIWALTILLIVVEAIGFSYVLAGYTIPLASESQQQMGALGIAFLISTILVAFTHFAGHELYKSGQIKKARRGWSEDNRRFPLTTGTVPLANPQYSDDSVPTYTQLSNRVGTDPTYAVTIATVIIVAVIAIFATYVRLQVLEKQIQQQVTSQTAEKQISSNAVATGLDMSGNDVAALPDADLKANKQTDDKAIQDEANLDRHGGWGTFVVLAFVFVFLQLLGGLFGFRWGFAGQNSADAYRAIGGGRYATYAEVREHYRMVADVAQAKLENLQQRLMERNVRGGVTGQHAKGTFREFMELERIEDARERTSELEHAARKAAQAQQPTQVTVPAAPAAVAPTRTDAASMPIDEIIAQLDGLGTDKPAKMALLEKLPPSINDQVVAALKKRKEENDRIAQLRSAELEGLL
jgi:hypothetical protein